MTQPNIAAIERGTRVPSLAMAERLVRACGLQLRYELEPRHADVDAAVDALLDQRPAERLGAAGTYALITASRLAAKGIRLVLRPLFLVGIDHLLAGPDWAPGDRVAVRRLAVALADRGEATHGLDKAP